MTIGESNHSALGGSQPVMATPAQIEAEKTLLRLIDAPELIRIQAELRAELAATPRGQTRSGAGTLDEAIAQWTRSVVMAEIATYLPAPAIIWSTDDTPREWLGHEIGGIGMSGDNPDAVYRIVILEGTHRYEVLGRFDLTRRPVQQTLELHIGNLVTPPPIDMKQSDLTPLASISDRDLDIAPDGSFRFTVGPDVESPVHLKSVPGLLTLGLRDMLADWNQSPCFMELRQLDKIPPRHVDDAMILNKACADLMSFIRFWARFPDLWFGGPTGNKITPVQSRNGSLAGYMAAMSWDLRSDQAIVVTMDPGTAAYTGFQLMDRWMIAADAKRFQVCLNITQSAANPDGSFTYVISAEDPGVANWLDTTGLDEGLGLLRWQAVPPGGEMDPAGLVRDFRVVPLSDVKTMRDLPRVTFEQRKAQMAARVQGYNNRAR